MVDRPNLFIKIPATVEDLPANTQAVCEGISVNVTLVFSLERYRAVIDAYMAGLEKAADAWRDLSGIASVASFFVSRIDTEVDKRLDTIGTDAAKALRGKAAIASLAYELFEQRIATPRWGGAPRARRAAAAAAVGVDQHQGPVVARHHVRGGTGGPDTVNTMPEPTIRAVADHGELRGDAINGIYEESRQVIANLADMGISYEDVVKVLEDEGVAKFAASWSELAETIKGQLRQVTSN